MKTIGIAGIASLLLLSSVAPAAAMSPEAVDVRASQPVNAATGTEAVQPDVVIDDSEAPVDTVIKRDRAIELAKQYVTVPAGYKLQGVSYQSNMYTISDSRGSWNLSFSKQIEEGFYGDISVSIDSDSGKLLSYYISEYDPDKKYTFPPKVNLEQARKIASDYIAKLNPEEQAQLKYDEEYEKTLRRPLAGNVEYPLSYLRVVNGVVFPQNFIMLSVDGEGKIISYTQQWDPKLTFKAPINPISTEQAAEQFKKLADISLHYIVPTTPNGKAAPAVAYQMEPFLLDAQTGEALLISGIKKETQPQPVPVSDKPLTEGVNKALKLTKEQAASRVSSALAIPANAKLEDAAYNEATDPVTGVTSFEWGLSWSLASDKKEDGPAIYATVDSSTGAILNYSKYDFHYAEPATRTNATNQSYDQLKAKAIEAVKKLLPAYAHELYLQPQFADISAEDLQQMPYYDYYFQRIVNGVHTQYDSVSINFDRKTGEIQEFNSSLINSLYPAEPPKVISAEKAKEILLSQYRVEQQYVVVDKGYSDLYHDYVPQVEPPYAVAVPAASPVVKPDKAAEQPETKLVYTLKPIYEFREPAYLDAVSGEWRNSDTNEIVKPRNADPTDLKGHPAEEAIRLMLDYDVLEVVDGKVLPDGLITRGELVKMLIATLNGGYFPVTADYADRSASFSDVSKDSKYFPFVENAIDYNLIDRASGTFQPEAALTRSEVADLLVRALGYRKLSEVEGLFATKANDVADLPNQGAIAIVSSLGILSLNGEAFSPYEQVTRAQAAATFYNFLKALSQLQDSPVAKG
jgi:hypothetical protein